MSIKSELIKLKYTLGIPEHYRAIDTDAAVTTPYNKVPYYLAVKINTIKNATITNNSSTGFSIKFNRKGLVFASHTVYGSGGNTQAGWLLNPTTTETDNVPSTNHDAGGDIYGVGGWSEKASSLGNAAECFLEVGINDILYPNFNLTNFNGSTLEHINIMFIPFENVTGGLR